MSKFSYSKATDQRVFNTFFTRKVQYPVRVEVAPNASVIIMDGEPKLLVKEEVIEGGGPMTCIITLQGAVERGLATFTLLGKEDA